MTKSELKVVAIAVFVALLLTVVIFPKVPKEISLAGTTNLDSLELSETLTAEQVTSTDDATVSDDLTVTGDTAMTGNLTIAGHLKNTVGIITATTTLTVDSGNIQFLDTNARQTTITLPTKTATGTMFRFQVRGALTGVSYQITSAEKDNISGTLIVAGAVVDCRDEDFINIVTDGEAIGDYVEVMSLGTTGWAIVNSGVLTSAKMTCTDPS